MNDFEQESKKQKEEEVNLFDIAENQNTPSNDYDNGSSQVDLFEYAKQYDEAPSEISWEQDDENTTEKKENIHTGKKTHKKGKSSNKITIVLTAILLVVAILITGVTATFINYYNKLDYVADDTEAYYYDISADDVMSSSFVTNILLIGSDERTAEFSDNSRADCTMIMSINSYTHTISLVSLERGMSVKYLKSENEYASDLLTHVFKYGGAGLLMNTVQNTFKIEVNKYVRVNFNTFKQIIDLLGGVDIELSSEEVRGLNTEKHSGQVIKRTLTVGENHLSGEEALLYARLRWIDSDFKRVERQRKVILSVKEKLKDASYSQLIDIANEILPLVRTNITATEMLALLFNVSLALDNDTQQMTVPVAGTYAGLGAVDFDQNADILQQTLYSKTNVSSDND